LKLRRGQAKTYPQITVRDLCDRFMDSVAVEKSRDTYLGYKHGLQLFIDRHGPERAREVTRLMAVDFRDYLARLRHQPKDGPPRQRYKPKTVNNALIALRACWNWGVRFDLVAENPFSKVTPLHAQGRRRLVTDKEFRALLRHADALFREMLFVFRQMPVRQQDVRNLSWDMIDWDNHVWSIQRHKGSRTAKVKKPRIIPMSATVEKILRRWQKRRGDSPWVFLNEDGRPWTKDALCLRMRRCRERAGILPDENGEQLVLYSNRHTYLTNAACAGNSTPLVQELAGHTDIRMTQRYIHAHPRDVYEAGQKAVERLRQRK
jgi:integrase